MCKLLENNFVVVVDLFVWIGLFVKDGIVVVEVVVKFECFIVGELIENVVYGIENVDEVFVIIVCVVEVVKCVGGFLVIEGGMVWLVLIFGDES